MAHLVKRFRQVKGVYVNHRTTVDIVIDNTIQWVYCMRTATALLKTKLVITSLKEITISVQYTMLEYNGQWLWTAGSDRRSLFTTVFTTVDNTDGETAVYSVNNSGVWSEDNVKHEAVFAHFVYLKPEYLPGGGSTQGGGGAPERGLNAATHSTVPTAAYSNYVSILLSFRYISIGRQQTDDERTSNRRVCVSGQQQTHDSVQRK